VIEERELADALVLLIACSIDSFPFPDLTGDEDELQTHLRNDVQSTRGHARPIRGRAGTVIAGLGGRHDLFVDGADVPASAHVARRSPIDLERHSADFAVASRTDVGTAMQAAQAAFPTWRALPVAERAD